MTEFAVITAFVCGLCYLVVGEIAGALPNPFEPAGATAGDFEAKFILAN